MKSLTVILLGFETLLSVVMAAQIPQNVTVSTKMKANGIVPDIIDVAPDTLLEIEYPSGVVVNLGNELTPTQVKDVPDVCWEADCNANYTLLMTDPDAPNRQSKAFGEVRHWLVVNIPGNKIEEGQVLYEYIGSGPPEGSGLHRYIFLVFKQKELIKSDIFVTNKSREGRLSTKTRDLIKDFDLGDPIAGNFYQAQFDDYVPILQKQLGGAPPKPPT